MKKNIALIFIVFSFLTGCTNRMFYKHPEYHEIIKIDVSDDTVSTFTETPAEDHLIPNSQVFIGGKGFFQKNIGLTPLVGALTAVGIDRSLNASEIEDAKLQLQIKFDAELSSILKSAALKQAGNLKYEVVRNNDTAEIKLLPSARFDIRADSRASLSFRVTARCKDNVSGKEGEKNYYYTIKNTYPIASEQGWVDNNAILLKQATTRALTLLGQVIIQDVSGLFNQKLLPEQRLIVAHQGPYEKNSILLAEYPEYSIYMPLHGDDAISSLLFIEER